MRTNRPLTCPVCGKDIVDSAPSAEDFFPFCGSRCRQIDFYRWCEGRYAIVEPLSEEQLQDELHRLDDVDRDPADG